MMMNSPSELDLFRPIPFYFLNTTDPADYTEKAIQQSLQKIKELGFGGIVLFNKPPLGFNAKDYLSEFWFTLTGRFIQAARRLKLQLWINDGFDFPPGDAAGRIKAVDPSLKQYRLNPNPEGKLEVLEVPWGFPAFEEPESGTYFRQFVYEEYYKRFAPYFGDGITGFFSDADNRRFNAHIQHKMEGQYYPWSPHFSQKFLSRFGYRIEERLKELFTNQAPKVQRDYWLLCGELYQQWFVGNHAWCTAHNVLYAFHTSDTGPLNYVRCRRSSAFTEGDPLALLSHSDYPGTDHEIKVLDGGTHYDHRYYTPKATLGGAPDFIDHPRMNGTSWDIRAKYAGSASVLNKRSRTMCEMFAATNWSASFNDLRRIAAWQIIQGINFIVPHAVHHRFRGEIKFFAPPEFTHSTLQYGMRQFNDMLAHWCKATSAGEYCAEYAVIDPTRQVWEEKDSTPFFQLCDQLNRRPEGYLIVPENYNGPISHIIDPLKEIPKLPAPQITFTGGEIAFMRRKLHDQEYLLAANIWNPKPLSGTLTYKNKNWEIELEPGEIAILGGPFESYRSPQKSAELKSFSGEYGVSWQAPNLIPFDQKLHFTAPKGLKLMLMLPADYKGKFTINGKTSPSGNMVKLFDDNYLRFPVDAAEENTIVLEEKLQFTTPALLQGEFDVELKTSGDYHKIVYQQYVMDMYEPEKADFALSPRRNNIRLDCGWEKQGQIFYSGEALISLGQVEFQTGDFLDLPSFCEIAALLLDGKEICRKALSPYRFELPAGKHKVSLRLWNRMANRLERFALPAGLTQPPVLKHHPAP